MLSNGGYIAECPCGAMCGASFSVELSTGGDATYENDPYVACPNCSNRGTQSGIKWVFVPENEGDEPRIES